MHGKSSDISIDGTSKLLKDMPQGTQVARYHSLAATEVPESLIVTATDGEGEIMAVEHVGQPVFGVQFHPESIMTPEGKAMVENFVEIARKQPAKPPKT